ncbi:MAG: 1-acyl-sn-glycerol-3-phosphate acyltransferase [Chitinophagales bacterium]|nr:1-acyl-sn-glycerol-3-phosphate acyltransferase [Chitinophagales bacterium]
MSSIPFYMRLVYAFFRGLTWLGLSVFYRKRVVLGREHARFKGPAIVVCNHPCTLMDPLNAGLHISEEMFFLANYGLFKHPVSAWFFSRLFCIPVKRREDVAEGEARDNEAAFEASFKHLERKGVLFIAAEGVSWMNRYVRPFKTGAARIALGAERRSEWQSGVKIIPVGLSYEAPRLFRKRVVIAFGPPIDPLPWAEAYAQNPEQAVDELTETLRSRVADLTLDSGQESKDAWVDQMEMIARQELEKTQGMSAGQAHLRLKSTILAHRNDETLIRQTALYSEALQQSGLTHAGVATPKVSAWPLLLLWPFWLLGYVFWFLPCYLPLLLCRKMNIYPGYDSNIKMLAGLITFPLALWGGWELVFALSGMKWLAWLSVPVWISLGYVAEYVMDVFTLWQASRKARHFRQSQPEAWQELMQLGASSKAVL